ncbi:GDSL-type esterase/lipase family protein [Frondihabitans australicus]|uniref:Lysophospholipase L1-like esterase n=1 Tax=Frondihabitans australicus TaxID=386892 RepID=A0A495ID52_9MICO|nr:GDSL-type esterase/lipase family protein [Frondihabitans australicus]RKR73849.1 lysophospholipase L1-like esterase [Frondihabitans australicus]
MTDERLLFVGASLVEQGDWAAWFPDDEAINLGVSGETTADVLARLDDVVAAEPDSIVLQIGGNDFARRRSVEQVVRTIENIMVDLRRRLPGVRLLLVSITPRGAEFAERIRDANRHLRQFAATVRAQYLDVWPALADGDVLRDDFTTDGVHLTEAGYQAWVDELRPALERLREEPPMSRPISIIRDAGAL